MQICPCDHVEFSGRQQWRQASSSTQKSLISNYMQEVLTFLTVSVYLPLSAERDTVLRKEICG